MRGQRGADSDGHADHAEEIALAARGWARQAAQRHDEEHAGDQIQKCRQIGVHLSAPLSV